MIYLHELVAELRIKSWLDSTCHSIISHPNYLVIYTTQKWQALSFSWIKIILKYDFSTALTHHSPSSFYKKFAFFSPMTQSHGFKFYCLHSAFHFHQTVSLGWPVLVHCYNKSVTRQGYVEKSFPSHWHIILVVKSVTCFSFWQLCSNVYLEDV